jgi:hypothetical protein
VTPVQDRRFKLLSVILVVALVLALVGGGLLFKAWHDAERERDDAKDRLGELDSAESAARALLVDMTSYDYRQVDHTYDWLDQLTNSDVKTNFAKSEDKIERLVRIGKVVAKGEVEESAYRPGADGKSVVVVAFVHQTITDGSDNQKTEDQWATLTMVPGDSDSGWLAANVQLSGIPDPAGTVTTQ